jgi:signal transduction histidine kinase
LELDLTEFSLLSALGETVRALAVRAHRKGLELVCDIKADVPDDLIGDVGRLKQVLLNLIGNAIKFTTEGEGIVLVTVQNAHGFQVIQTLRARQQLNGGHLPVVAVTARSAKETRELCLAAGMDEFLVKPVRAN